MSFARSSSSLWWDTPMKCSQVESILSDYLDGELSPVQAAQVRDHLHKCLRCEARWRMLRQTVRLVAHLGNEKCPVDLRPAVALAVQSPRADRDRRAPLLSVALFGSAGTLVAAAALAAVLLVKPVPSGAQPVESDVLPAVVAEVPVHEQYDLATGMGTTDGLLLALPSEEKVPPASRIQVGPSTTRNN